VTDSASDLQVGPVLEAYAAVRRRLDKACRATGRDPSEVTLTAVTKQQPWEKIDPIVAAGHRVFGENRVQEAEARWADRRPLLPNLELRLIGPLQSNKTREAVALFDVIETLDREKLARALADEAGRGGRLPRLYVQVNTGEEPQKAGVVPREADGFIAAARQVYGLALEGLMCIPPAGQEPAMHFALLARIAERNGLEKLSMGMSEDYETAVRFGATHVRVGSAIFGARG
jgi:pyridoxal phosphate enzyme (YggS family)